MGYHDLVLDRQVLLWILVPLTVCVALIKLLTQYAHQMMSGPAGGASKELKDLKEQNAVTRSQRLRMAVVWIPEYAFKMRREYFVAKDTGLFNQKPQSRSLQETLATDPSMMVDMMKKNLTGLVPQLALGALVNQFFSGFVMGKVPFSLSPRFRPMVQRGIDLLALDCSYFTSLSYYMVLLFGLRGVFSLVFDENAVDETELMRRQMNPMGNSPGFDADNAFKTEKQALALIDHEWILDDAEDKAAGVLRNLLAAKPLKGAKMIKSKDD